MRMLFTTELLPLPSKWLPALHKLITGMFKLWQHHCVHQLHALLPYLAS